MLNKPELINILLCFLFWMMLCKSNGQAEVGMSLSAPIARNDFEIMEFGSYTKLDIPLSHRISVGFFGKAAIVKPREENIYSFYSWTTGAGITGVVNRSPEIRINAYWFQNVNVFKTDEITIDYNTTYKAPDSKYAYYYWVVKCDYFINKKSNFSLTFYSPLFLKPYEKSFASPMISVSYGYRFWDGTSLLKDKNMQ